MKPEIIANIAKFRADCTAITSYDDAHYFLIDCLKNLKALCEFAFLCGYRLECGLESVYPLGIYEFGIWEIDNDNMRFTLVFPLI